MGEPSPAGSSSPNDEASTTANGSSISSTGGSASPGDPGSLQQGEPASQTSSPSATESGTGSGTEKPKKAKKEYRVVQIPTAEQIVQEDFMNNCAVRAILSGVMGSMLGVAFGIFMGTMDSTAAGLDPTGTAAQQTARQVLKEMAVSTGKRSLSYAKGFGAMGFMFAGSECVIEKVRAKHDIYNSVGAGCAAGAALAHSTGPRGMAAGCLTFAAFSAFIDKIMEH